ncbi:MAG: UDP-glucose/GDP-mannose dehydrogenase family protein [Candidatus Bathyarchaeia archaeon]
MKIGVIGLGVVGLAHAVCLAYKGFMVYGVDLNAKRIQLIRDGHPPFDEPSLRDMLNEVINRTLDISTEYDALKDADLTFIAVDTPTRENGTQDISSLERAIKDLASVWKEKNKYGVVVVKSTVLPGTSRLLTKIFDEVSGRISSGNIGFAVNPEFLREGSAIQDIFYPYRVIIGGIDEKSAREVADLWSNFYKKVGRVPPIFIMGLEEAELVKYVSNTFLAMRVSFANTIASICEKLPNCDAQRVLEAAGYDPRIGKEYLRPGPGYSGPCLPKDIKAFMRFLRERNIRSPLIDSIHETNELQQQKTIDILVRELGDLKGKIIAILGLSFKAGTGDIRGSIAIKIIEKLLRMGAIIRVHDPLALENAKSVLGNSVKYCNVIEEAVSDVDSIIIFTEWEVYREINPKIINKRTLIIDFRRVLNAEEFKGLGFRTYIIGLSS